MNYSLIITNWLENKSALSFVRRKVFIEEQQVPEDMEWDEFDEISHHVIALDDDNQAIACGRLKPDGQIGRMAVINEWRNRGVGSAILGKLIEEAAMMGLDELYLHAQVSAIPFYTRHGFHIASEEFMEAGIPHRTMKKIR